MDESETLAIYIGVLRHGLDLPPGSDALRELQVRLSPPDPAQRPPARAPGIARLASALRSMRRGAAPAVTIERFRDDLAFLRMFDRDTSWSAEALTSLLADVSAVDASRPAEAAPAPDKVVSMRRKRRPAEGA